MIYWAMIILYDGICTSINIFNLIELNSTL